MFRNTNFKPNTILATLPESSTLGKTRLCYLVVQLKVPNGKINTKENALCQHRAFALVLTPFPHNNDVPLVDL